MSEFTTIYIHNGEGQKTLRQRADMRKHCGPYQWTPSEPGTGRGFYQSSKGLSMGDSTIDLRLKLANDCLYRHSRLSRTDGYYCDEHCDQTLIPIVALLPHGRGFLAGWTMGAGMCASIGPRIYGSALDAAYAAHSMAEFDAEKEREYQIREQERMEEEEETND